MRRNIIFKKELICIFCPLGCNLNVEYQYHPDKIVKIFGNKCKRGIKYAEKEIFCPTRVLTTTVRTLSNRVLPVRSIGEVPKDKMKEIIKELAKIIIKIDIKLGNIVSTNLLGLRVDIMATSNIKLNKKV